jgi:vacuolar-type H+-ATPase subunit H
MSIFDSIQAAENKAEKMRAEAVEKVNTLLEETRIASEEKAKELYSQAELEEEKINAETEKLIHEKEKEITALYQEQDQIISKKAETKSDEVVAFIIRKVFEV